MNNNKMHPYTYVGLGGLARINFFEAGCVPKLIKSYQLKEYLSQNFPMVLEKTRKINIVKQRSILIYLIDKNIHCFKDKKSKIANVVFGIDHSTFIYSANKMQDIIDMHQKHLLFSEEISLLNITYIKFMEFIYT